MLVGEKDEYLDSLTEPHLRQKVKAWRCFGCVQIHINFALRQKVKSLGTIWNATENSSAFP
jgi:hypothetical protein